VNSKLLVIGYGNTLRNDDAVGPLVVEEIERLHLPGVTTLVCPLLTPELAEPVSQADQVVFVDASIEPARDVQLRELAAAGSSRILAHSANPQTVLALARDLFGHAPQTWCLSIPVENLELGEELTALARAGMRSAVETIIRLVTS
jgi:hydrogenase maturation protease